MQKKYTITLIIILLLLVFNVILYNSYKTYQERNADRNESSIVVQNGLSINYLNGNKINTSTDANYDFSITNTSSEILYYYIKLDDIKKDYDATFKISSNTNSIKTIEKQIKQPSFQIASRIAIEPGMTHSYQFTITNAKKQQIEATININKELMDQSIASTILKNNLINETEPTKAGLQTALSDEGLIETTDNTGVSYYFRGATNNNYMQIGSHMWRVVSINGDRSVKLVYDGVIDSKSFQNIGSAPTTVFSETDIAKYLQSWYEENLSTFDDYFVNYNYCVNDVILAQDGDKVTFDNHNRLFIDYSPIMGCLAKTSNANIGLLSLDEIILAGATNLEDNTSFYLYNSSITSNWWTLTPADSTHGDARYYEISASGKVVGPSNQSDSRGLRPVITINKNTTINGSGTASDPYRFTTSS